LKLSDQIKSVMNCPAQHLGIRQIQDIFRQNEHKLCHWFAKQAVPAENNQPESDLRRSVVARKVGFGSITDNGAAATSTLTTAVTSLKKRAYDVEDSMKKILDKLPEDVDQDPYGLLFLALIPEIFKPRNLNIYCQLDHSV
jgi:hypothetical protein